MKRLHIIIGAVALAAMITPSVASASGFLVARFGGEQGHPTSSHPSAIYFNPAGLSLNSGTRVYVEGLFGTRSANYTRPTEAIDTVINEGDSSAGTPTNVSSANSGKATLSDLFAAPFAAVVSDLGIKNLGVAAGVYVPFGGSASWNQNSEYSDNNAYPGAVDGVQRWSSIEGKIQSLYVTLAGSYYIPKLRLSIGAGLNVVSTSVENIRARNASGTDDLVSSNGTMQEGRALVDVSNTALSVGAGVIWRPTDAVSVGVSYQSRPNFGTTNLKGTLQTKLSLASPSTSDIALRWPLPDVVRAGVAFRPTRRSEVRVFGDFTRWSVLDNHCAMTMETAEMGCLLDEEGRVDPNGASVAFNIPRRWEDTFGLRAGGSYWLNAEREVFVGLGYDGNAIPDTTIGPDIPDSKKMTASIGGRVLLTPELRLSATFTQVIYFEREVELRDESPFEGLSRLPDHAGSYQQSVSLFNMGVEYMF